MEFMTTDQMLGSPQSEKDPCHANLISSAIPKLSEETTLTIFQEHYPPCKITETPNHIPFVFPPLFIGLTFLIQISQRLRINALFSTKEGKLIFTPLPPKL